MKITFYIPDVTVEPKQGDRSSTPTDALGRPRRSSKTGRVVHIHRAVPKVAQNAKLLGMLMVPHIPKEPLTGPLVLHAAVFYPWLRAHTKQVRTRGCWPKDTFPDRGNLLKQIEDVMEKVGFYKNDGQIFSGGATKWWADRAGLLVELRTWSDEYGFLNARRWFREAGAIPSCAE